MPTSRPSLHASNATTQSLPRPFLAKKTRILQEISTHDSASYSDASPKGTIDSEIIDLINEINEIPGWITTSSCAGRCAVFVEGRKAQVQRPQDVTTTGGGGGDRAVRMGPSTNYDKADGGMGGVINEDEECDANGDGEDPVSFAKTLPAAAAAAAAAAGPGGKGFGNRWLYVSHGRVHVPVPGLAHQDSDGQSVAPVHDLLNLAPPSDACDLRPTCPRYSPGLRLIKVSFSPLILHVLCADLRYAKALLVAAINAGFRESGVQSLKVLDDPDAGVMLGIRTAGLGFESVVGYVEQDAHGEEVYRSCVSEEYLALCVGVVNERFLWNEVRRDRLVDEVRRLSQELRQESAWEDSDLRRWRKREEGLERQKTRKGAQEDVSRDRDRDDDGGGITIETELFNDP